MTPINGVFTILPFQLNLYQGKLDLFSKDTLYTHTILIGKQCTPTPPSLLRGFYCYYKNLYIPDPCLLTDMP